MVSLWPFRSDDSSAASFEKALSNLSSKITKSQLQLDTLRQRSRRLKALWTLYSSFAYLLCAIILALVVGWRNWSPWEYSAVAGSPLLIYLIREAISTYYTYRIDNVAHRLEEQQTERAKTIDKLKAATKYNSTQQLLEKYGGVTPSPQSSPKPAKGKSPSRTPRSNQKQPQRTSMGPPPTANIPRGEPASLPSTPQPQPPSVAYQRPNPSAPSSPVSITRPGPPEFAPNAFPAPPQYDRGGENGGEGKWYDRVLDVLLGEDETSPRNRIVLICQHCRLVNGQAPPGIKRLEDVGEWRCMACGGKNGVVDEGKKVVNEIKEMVKESQEQTETASSGVDEVEAKVEEADENSGEDGVDEKPVDKVNEDDDNDDLDPPKVRRRQPKGGGQTEG